MNLFQRLGGAACPQAAIPNLNLSRHVAAVGTMLTLAFAPVARAADLPAGHPDLG
jgi:hypothetical protein